MGELSDRRSNSTERLTELRQALAAAEGILSDAASVYATGSYGRHEAGRFSDLDLFIVGLNRDKNDKLDGSQLSRLDEICVKAELIKATRARGFPEFSGDGEYLTQFSVDGLTKTLGTPEDDVTNTFTARLLLVLESSPLLGKNVYERVMTDVIAAYWRDFEGRESRFLPGFLCNDILRLWRTFCINYEARTERAPEREKAKGRLKNFKLKHSRLLTCFSGILYLLAVYVQSKTVTPNDALAMTALTPINRLEWLKQQSEFGAAHERIDKLMGQYEKFLSQTNFPEKDLVDKLMNDEVAKAFSADSRSFGDSVFEILRLIGTGNEMYRLLVV